MANPVPAHFRKDSFDGQEASPSLHIVGTSRKALAFFSVEYNSETGALAFYPVQPIRAGKTVYAINTDTLVEYECELRADGCWETTVPGWSKYAMAQN